METLHDDVGRLIWDFVGFGNRRGANVAVYRRVNKRWRDFLSDHVRVEIDHGGVVGLFFFLKHCNDLRTMMEQKRNAALQWDDFRGYFILTGYDKEQWLYYDHLLHTYFFTPPHPSFPFFKGHMYFYELCFHGIL